MAKRRKPRRPAARRGPVSIGDVVMASAALKPRDQQTRAMILGLLGFEVAPVVAAGKQVGPWKLIEGSARQSETPVTPPPSLQPPPPPATSVPRLEGAVGQSTL